MSSESHAGKEIVGTHPDGHRAVVLLKTKGKTYYEAFGPNGLSLGVYDFEDEAKSAAQWAWDFLEEEPAIRRLTLMQLIIDKLALQYPMDAVATTMSLKG
ncbi:hypothetical protein H0A66_01685 [Alcaligenaceae bacterium]|nr:hypothetical protein [Alcaligenaceae bacterium]